MPTACCGTEKRKGGDKKARQWRANVASLHKVLDTQTGWWRTQSISNLSQHPNSLLTGKLTGNFVESVHLVAILNADTRANSMACSKIPYATEQGIISKKQGI